MTKLSDTQPVILSAAAQRDDGAVLPLPETLKIKGGAVAKVLSSLKARGLIEHQGARAATTRRRSGSPAPASRPSASRPRTTRQSERDAAPTRARRRPMPESRGRRLGPGDRADRAATPARQQGQGGSGQAGQGCTGRQAHARAPAPSRPR